MWWWKGRVFISSFICLCLVLFTLHRCKHVTVCIRTLLCLGSRWLLCVCVCVVLCSVLLSVLLIVAHVRCHSSRLPLWVCVAIVRIHWIYRSASLWYATIATSLLCRPLTLMRLWEGFSLSLSALLIVILYPVRTEDNNRCCRATEKFINTLQGVHAFLLRFSSHFIPLSPQVCSSACFCWIIIGYIVSVFLPFLGIFTQHGY